MAIVILVWGLVVFVELLAVLIDAVVVFLMVSGGLISIVTLAVELLLLVLLTV